MAEADHRKPMFAESGRGFFLLKYVSKYKKFEFGKRVSELENQESLRLIDELDLKHLLEDFKIKYDGLLVEFQEKKIECELVKSELKELSESKIGVGNTVKEYQVMCNRLKEHIIKILGDKRIASERDKEAKQRIIKLEEEIKKMGIDQREKCVEFSKEIIDLKTVNQRAEEEMEILKKKFADLECGKQRVEDEMEIWKKKFTDSECANRSVEDELEIWKKKFTDSECGKTRADNEIELLKEKCRKSEIQASEMLNYGVELEDYKTKCHGLSMVIKEKELECADFEGKLKNLMLTKVALEGELQDYKTTCSGMKDEITGLTNAGKIMSEREKTAHERIAYFEELVKKMESDEKCMLVQLKNENIVLECGLKRAEDKTENWKKRFSELNMGLGNLQKEVGNMDGRVDVASVAHLTKSEQVISPAFPPGANFSSLQGNFEDVHVSDTPKIKSLCHHSADVKVEQKNICSHTKVELVSEAKQQLGSETGGSCKENLVLLKQDSVTTSSTCIIEIESEDEVIEIGDSEDDKEVPSKHTCNNKGEDVEHSSTERTLKTLNKNLKRPLSVSGSRDLDIPFSSTMKRCKTSDTSESVRQEDDKCLNIKI